MWLTLLGLLRRLNLKTVGIAAVVVCIFVAGWTANGWRYRAKIEAERAEIAKNYAKQKELFLQQYRDQQTRDQAAAEALSADLERIRTQRKELEARLRGAAVVKPHDEICKDGGSGNPFGPDFVRLWNGTDATD
jgi:Tfp pilus assembly protein PilO